MNEKQSCNDVGLFSMVPVVTGRQESIIILRPVLLMPVPEIEANQKNIDSNRVEDSKCQ